MGEALRVRSKAGCSSGLAGGSGTWCARTLAAVVSLGLAGCVAPAPLPPSPAPERLDAAVFRRVATERAELLERENERLRADLRAAEATLLEIESGMRSTQRRAEAVSLLAEARIRVDRAAARAPWRHAAAAEAREKLDEAERQLADGHFGSAIFFVSRATRVAAGLEAEAELVSRAPGVHSVKPRRANLRAEPSTEGAVLAVLGSGLPVFVEGTEGEWALVRSVAGEVGWMRGDLLAPR